MMPTRKPSARTVAKGSPTDIRIDHARIEPSDHEWLAGVQALTLWAVDVPDGFLASLPELRLLDLRGGSGRSLSAIEGCRQLEVLIVNQIRGLEDLTNVAALTNLKLLSLYGLPQLRIPPSLAALRDLARLELGSLKGLATIAPLLDAPSLRELLLIRSVALTEDDADLIVRYPTLEAFSWYTEDVPNKVWQPLVERVRLPRAQPMHPRDWMAARSEQ